MKKQDIAIEIFSTCPQYVDSRDGYDSYFEQIRRVAQWSEEYGCKGILIYTDNRQIDPWVVAQVVIESTEKLCPLIAVQPVYMHPYTVAKKIVSIGKLYNRRIYLNLVAGGFRNDLKAMNDDTPHDRRYDRLIEYMTIISDLLKGGQPVTFNGEFYQVNNLSMTPEPDPEYYPGIFQSGSSQAGLNAANALQVTAIQYPLPLMDYSEILDTSTLEFGIRVGIIARSQDKEAWEVACQRFPDSREGELTHKLALKTTDSQWYKDLATVDKPVKGRINGTKKKSVPGASFWIHPFKTYGTMCPYLVGSYELVAHELSQYMEIGYRTFILDIPRERDDLVHTQRTFEIVKTR